MSLRIIGGKFKGRSLKAPNTPFTRPTQSVLREAVFNMCQHEIEGARFLDVFAGSGAMGLEAISRGAEKAFFIEKNPMALHCIQHNIGLLNVHEKAEVFSMKVSLAMKILEKKKVLFDLIYVDPPYSLEMDVDEFSRFLLPNGTLFLEKLYEPKNNDGVHLRHLKLIQAKKFGDSSLFLLRHP